MTRILLTTESLNAGGAERQLFELAKGLTASNEFHVTVATLTRNGHYDEKIQQYAKLEYLCSRSNEWKSYKTLKKTYEILESHSFDIVHSFSLNDSRVFSLFSLWFNYHWINGTIRDTDLRRNRRQLEKLLLLRLSKNIIANSKTGLAAYGVKGNRTKRVIYNGIDLNRFNDFHVSDNSHPQIFHIGVVASLSDYKDHYTIFDAISRISAYPVLLHVVGDGPKMAEYKEYIKKLDISNKVLFYGKIGNVESIIKKFDCGVLCSYNKKGEGISNSVLEFMSIGLPVIATRVGAIEEIIIHNHNGLIIDAEMPSQLAESILVLMKNPRRAKELGENGRESVIENFSYSTMLQAYADYYKEILS